MKICVGDIISTISVGQCSVKYSTNLLANILRILLPRIFPNTNNNCILLPFYLVSSDMTKSSLIVNISNISVSLQASLVGENPIFDERMEHRNTSSFQIMLYLDRVYAILNDTSLLQFPSNGSCNNTNKSAAKVLSFSCGCKSLPSIIIKEIRNLIGWNTTANDSNR